MRLRRPELLAAVPPLTLALLALPVAAGLFGTLLPAFGYLPALGGDTFNLDAWRALLATPGIGRSVLLSLTTGLAATLIALAMTILIAAAGHGTRAFRLVRRVISPLLAVPHAAAAFGLAFLIAPSGWLARLLSPWATGWQNPPDWLIVNDPAGLALIAGLVAKEVPFLMLMTLAALPQADADRSRATALGLGYGPVTAWVKAVLPRVYPQIRLAVYAVLAYALSSVEVAMILGPTTPAPLAVRLTDWMRSPDLALWFKASAGAMLQLALVLGALAFWRAGEALASRILAARSVAGGRGRADPLWAGLAAVSAFLATVPVLMGLAGLGIWSLAGLWSFPDTFPATLDARIWMGALPTLAETAARSFGLGLASAFIALALVLASLEAGVRSARTATPGTWLLYLPLLIPQVAFLFGLQVLGARLGLDGTLAAVTLAHLVFVLPYVYLSLSDPWRALDPRFATVAATLGASRARIFWRMRLPLLIAPILTAFALGFAVSVGLYLPTLLIGAGRVQTLTTEAVALASGGDRRLIGVFGIAQMLAPMAAFALALGVPALLWRNRRGLRGRA